MTFLWILLGIVYVACWIYFGLATFRKGHYWMFWIGFFLPILWIIGAFIAPTDRAAARFASTGGSTIRLEQKCTPVSSCLQERTIGGRDAGDFRTLMALRE